MSEPEKVEPSDISGVEPSFKNDSKSPEVEGQTNDGGSYMEPESQSINEKALLRKLDMRILPGLTILYLLSFLDRSNGIFIQYSLKYRLCEREVELTPCSSWKCSFGGHGKGTQDEYVLSNCHRYQLYRKDH